MIYIRLFGDYKLNDYCSAWMRLCQFIQEEKLPMGEVMPYCIYHDDPKVTPAEKLRTDVCMVLPSFATAKGDIGFKQLAAGRYAIFLYKGPYEHLQAVYDTIYGKYIPEMECSLRDESSAERYLNNPADTAPEELLTEIYGVKSFHHGGTIFTPRWNDFYLMMERINIRQAGRYYIRYPYLYCIVKKGHSLVCMLVFIH